MAKCILCGPEKGPPTDLPKGRGAYRPHPLRWDSDQALAEARKAVEGSIRNPCIKYPVWTETLCQCNPLTEPVDMAKAALGFFGDDQLEAIRAEVDGNELG